MANRSLRIRKAGGTITCIARRHYTNRRIVERVASGQATARQNEPAIAPAFPPEIFLCAGTVFFVALALYVWTVAPTVTATDSGELIVVAHSLGVAHPPGFPLWAVVAHLASLIPFGNVAWRINISSALFGALTSAMLTLVVAELLTAASHPDKSRARARRNDASEMSGGLLVLVSALAAGLLMAFSRTLWGYATVAEVYAFNALLILIIFFLLLRWRRTKCAKRFIEGAGSVTAKATPPSRDDSPLYAAAFLFGLALGVHHVTVVLTLPALAAIVYRTEGPAFFKSRRFGFAAMLSVAAFAAVYSYLPIAASCRPIINWGEPNSLPAIWSHITGRQYQSYFSLDPKLAGEQLMGFGRIALREFGHPWLPGAIILAVAGIHGSFQRDRTAFWFFCLLIGADLAYAAGYVIAEDKDAYYLNAFGAVAIAAGLGLHRLSRFLISQSGRVGRVYALMGLIGLLLPATALSANWPFNNRRHNFIVHDYVENLLSSIEPRGLLLTFDWQVASPMFYAQEVEQRRRDAKVVDIHLLRRSWYFDYLRRAYPDLIERSRDKIEPFVVELKQWEKDEKSYAGNQALLAKITTKFDEMLESIVTAERKVAPVYVTADFLSPPERDRKMTTWVTEKYGLVPQGIIFQLVADGTRFHPPRPWQIETRGLNDGSLRFENDDVVRTKIFPVYTTMLVNRGRYFALFGRHERAIDAFKHALALDSSLAIARRGLEESMGKLHNP